MDFDDHHPPSVPASACVPIAQISPALDRLETHSIRAVVTLVWPYSSATRSLSLLLAEPDFRLRRANGQVKVIFYGFAAERIAKTQVGIGDEVTLSLAGSRLVNNEKTGNCLAWDVHFDDRVFLEISRASEHLSTVNIEPPVETPGTTEETPVPPSTPQNASTRLGGIDPTPVLGSWGSPAFLQRSRTSFGGLIDTPLDPFAEEDGFVPGKGRKRPRYSMRNNDWRVIDEPESPEEKEGQVDWMEMLDDEVSEPKPEDEGMADDVEAIEPPKETQEAGITESQDASTIQPVSELFEARPGPAQEQVAGPARQSQEPDAARPLEPVEDKTGKNDLSPFIHLPTDTPRLLPIPSPGLPVPSPLAAPNNSNGYFSSFATSTTQTANGGVVTTETQTVMTKTEASADAQLQPGASQSQATGRLDPGMEKHRSPSTEHVPKTQDLDITSQIPGPSIMEEPASPLNTPNVDSKGASLAPEYDDEMHQLEYAAERASQEHITPAREVAEYSEWSEADEEDEGDADQMYAHDDLQNEDEWSEEYDSGDEVDEDEPNFNRQNIESKDSHGKNQIEIIDLDSDEREGEDMERRDPDDVTTSEADEYPTMHDEMDQRSSFLGDEQGDEEGDEGDDGDDGDEGDRKVDVDQRGESIPDKDEEINGDFDDDEGEYEDEEAYDNETRYLYESENDAPRGYDGYVDSGLESEDISEEDRYHQPSPPENVQPEIIVLDSDSDEEPQPSQQAQPTEQSKQDVSETQTPAPRAPSADQSSSSSESSLGSEDEGEMVITASAKEEFAPDAQLEYGRMVPTRMEEEQAVNAEVGVKTMEDKQAEVGLVESRRIEDVHVEDEQMEDEQMGDERLKDEQVKDEQVKDEQVKDEQVKDEQVKDEQVKDEQVEDMQVMDACRDYANAPILDSPSAAGIPDDSATLVEEGKALDRSTHEHGPALECSVQQSVIAESTSNADLAIDPNLFDVQVQANTEGQAPKRAAEQEIDYVEVRQMEPEQSPQESGLGGLVDTPIWLDGAISPGGIPVSVNKDPDEFSAIQRQQPATPGDSQGVDIDCQALISGGVNESPLMPQYTQEELLDSTLQHQVFASASANNDIASPIEHSSEPDPFVIAPEDRIEARKSAAHESTETQNHHEDAPISDGKGDESPEASERYFSPVSPDRDALGLHVKLAGFTPLATLVDNMNAVTNTISVICEVSPATSVTKDQIMSVQLTDPSMAGTSLPAQITRPHGKALPYLTEGDALMLRKFKVQSLNHSVMLVSGDASSWSRFCDPEDNVQVDEAPAECNAEERDYATRIRQWYNEAGAAMAADNQLQASIEAGSIEGTPVSSAAISDDESIGSPIADGSGSPSVARRKRRKRRPYRRITIHELRDGRRYTQVGSPSDKDSIHQLRDGTVYANP